MTEKEQVPGNLIGRQDTGLYLHVPFCARSCDFCAFYQIQPHREDVDRFLSGIACEAGLDGVARPVSTCFIGGGTPSVLHERDLDALCGLLVDRFCGPFEEWTVEMAPGSVRPEKLKCLKDRGVTRISMGVQSFQPRLLDALGRPHSPARIYQAWDWIREAGFESTSLDLIFAVPGQEAEHWQADLTEAIRLQPDHLSTYCLTFEEDTALYVRMSEGSVQRNETQERNLYLETWRRLETEGFQQYEISNFARPGHQCRHNLNTWRMGDWVGLGPAAASQQDGWRGGNIPDLHHWLKGLAEGKRGLSDRQDLNALQRAEDALIFGLRLREGVNLPCLGRRFPGVGFDGLNSLLTSLEKDGLLVRDPSGSVRLTEDGLLICDAIGVEVMGTLVESKKNS